MGCNVGKSDQYVRYVIGILLVVAYLLHWLSGTWGWVSLIVGLILVITAAIHYCPIYSIIGVSTCKE